MKKRCCTCKKMKNIIDFHVGQESCKVCRSLICKRYYINNKNKVDKRIAIYDQKIKEKSHWLITLKSIKQRCTNTNNQRYNTYGGRGIKCLLTKEEIKELWFRDKAYKMKKPSIDRIDNDGNYCVENCRFIEQTVHSKKSYTERNINKKGQFTHAI